ncbi:MAG: group II intron reverse transcriptase domain-containing protein [Anaerolineales bacterium]|nr:group II intron reverse transcriptase domain-containing protein [Anaerolineales bacterium]
MKTYRDLYAQVCSFDNLYHACRAARRGKRSVESVAAFEYDQEAELLRPRDELRTGAWQPGPYHSFYIHDPKRRLISAAPFRDRVVHHALVNVIEPIWERRFIHDSYANRVGKGTHRALDRCQQFARRWRYVLQCDLKQYFPSIDHALLRAELGRLICDERVLDVCDRILASGVGVLAEEYDLQWFPGDDLLAAVRPRGLPIGNLTSQFWANVYLNGFDHFVKRDLKCAGYVRYVDDFLLFGDRKADLHTWGAACADHLASLRLTPHAGRAQVYAVASGIPFLGFRVYPSHRRLKRRNGVNFQRRLRSLRRQCAEGQVTWSQITASVQGWVNHARYGDTWRLRQVVLSHA